MTLEELFLKEKELASLWADEVLSPAEVTPGSHKKARWLCSLQHEWVASVKNVVQGNRCPYCRGSKVLKGFNDLASTAPKAMVEEYCPLNETSITEITKSSNKKVWWICNKRHRWEQTPNGRLRGKGCPYCQGKKLLRGFNDLASQYPHVAKELAEKLDPSSLYQYSNKKVSWKCSCGHKWEDTVGRRVRGAGCPRCKNTKLLRGVNDFATLHPHLLKEWDYERNEVDPKSFRSYSEKITWWLCPKGHSYSKVVAHRVSGGSCPKCSPRSKGEEELYQVLSKMRPQSKIQRGVRSLITPYEIDFYFPEEKIAIEYNGAWWHSDEMLLKRVNMTSEVYHSMKTARCSEKGVKLFHVWEQDWLLKRKPLVEAIEEGFSSASTFPPLLTRLTHPVRYNDLTLRKKQNHG